MIKGLVSLNELIHSTQCKNIPSYYLRNNLLTLELMMNARPDKNIEYCMPTKF